MAPTRSRPPGRSRERSAKSPITGVSLRVTVPRGWPADLERLAGEAGLTVEKRKGDLSIGFAAATPEEALARLRLVAGLLAPRP